MNALHRTAPLALACVLLAQLPVPAAAQTAEPTRTYLDRWQPGLDLEAIAGLNVARTPLDLSYDVWLNLGYAGNLLVVIDRNTGVHGELLGPRLYSHLGASVAFLPWWQVGLNLPLVLYQDRGAPPSPALGPLAPLSSGGMGDLTVTNKFYVLSAERAWVDLALLLGLGFPTHYPRTAYLGSEDVTFSIAAAASRHLGPINLAANFGYHWRPTISFLDARIGGELRLGLGAQLNLESLTTLPLDAGVSWTLATRDDAPFQSINETPSELLFEATYRGFAPLAISLGAGFGVIAGVGTPDGRVYLEVRWAQRAPDADNDRVPDSRDQCPNEKEDYDGFEDGDGCPDPDNDQDGIPDEQDACPNEPETFNDYQDDDGCPDKAVHYEKGRIDLAGEVHFEVAKAVLKPRSRTLLNEIADILHKHPQITKVRIEGHTDSDGDDRVNQRLSQARANAVKAYLVSRGISEDRLKAEGFGESRPVASNATARGRAKNRRVEFVIEEMAEE